VKFLAERRRRWPRDDKARIVEETLAPGAKVPAAPVMVGEDKA
jgi:transposase-like protein